MRKIFILIAAAMLVGCDNRPASHYDYDKAYTMAQTNPAIRQFILERVADGTLTNVEWQQICEEDSRLYREDMISKIKDLDGGEPAPSDHQDVLR